MKIEIELISTVEATITIDGRKMKFQYRGKDGCFRLTGVSPKERDQTIGGMIAVELTSPLLSILQAHIPDEPSPSGDSWGTWEKLTDSAADAVYNALV